MGQPFTCMARVMAYKYTGIGSVGPSFSKIHMPAIGLVVQVGRYLVSCGKAPSFDMMPRTGRVGSSAYLQPSSLESHAPLLWPPAKTRFLSKQTVAASLSHSA